MRSTGDAGGLRVDVLEQHGAVRARRTLRGCGEAVETGSAAGRHGGGANEGCGAENDGGGGGAGGAGGAGTPGPGSTNPSTAGHGGLGLRTAIAGPLYPIGYPGPGSTTNGWFAGGGGGGADTRNTPGAYGRGGGDGGPYAGGGDGQPTTPSRHGRENSGGGGGSTYDPVVPGRGGSGIVIIAYPT